MIYPLSIKVAASVLLPPRQPIPGSVEAQNQAAAQMTQMAMPPTAPPIGAAGHGQLTPPGAAPAAPKPPATGRGTQKAGQPAGKPPAATPGAPSAFKGAFRLPLVKRAMEVSRRMAEPIARRTDFDTDPHMGAGETLAAQLADNLNAQMVPRRSPMDPAVAVPGHPQKHLM